MKTNEIATREGFPTHKLEILKPNEFGKNIIYKTLYFTETESLSIAQNINSPGQFLVFGAESYPKFGCFLEKMSPSEIKSRHQKYFNRLEEVRKTNAEKKQEEEDRKVQEWIKDNPLEWGKIKEKNEMKIRKQHSDKNKNSYFFRMSEKAQKGIFISYSRNEVKKILLKI